MSIKLSLSTWIVLTILLFVLPVVWWISYFLIKHIIKYFLIFFDEISNLGLLYKIKFNLFKKNKIDKKNNEIEEIWNFNNQKVENIIWTKREYEKNMPLFLAEDHLKSNQKLDKEAKGKKKKLLEKIIYEALVLRKEWKLEDYEKKIIEWLAIQPYDRDLNKLLADFYFSMWNYKKALSLLKKIIESDPCDHKAIWQIGEIYLMTSDFETAQLLLEKAISLNPSNPKYYMSMVELLYNTDRKQDAVLIMEKIIKLRPTVPSYLIALADLYYEIWDHDNAKKNYFRVLEYEPSNEKAKKRLKNLSN